MPRAQRQTRSSQRSSINGGHHEANGRPGGASFARSGLAPAHKTLAQRNKPQRAVDAT
jgi:hypothetical protein